MSLWAAQYERKKVFRKYAVDTEGTTSLLNEKRDSLGVCTKNVLTVE